MFATRSKGLDAFESKLILGLARVHRGGDDALSSALARLAETFTNHDDVAGAAVIAFSDQTEVLAVASSILRFSHDDERLKALPASLRLNESGTCLLNSGANGTDGDVLLGIAARHEGTLAGAVILIGKKGEPPKAFAKHATAIAPWVAETIQAAKKAEAASKIRQLHALTLSSLGDDEPDLPLIVQELARLFRAAVCTLLLEEPANQTLRLSASTDPDLGHEASGDGLVEYRRGDGLTGWVFASGEALRLAKTDDDEAVRRATGIERTGPRFAEHGPNGVANTQFLGVPVRAAGNTFGVLRMSRPTAAPRFSDDDEAALRFFGDLLGIALRRTWDLLIGRTIEESKSIAIAITHREAQEDGTFIPRLIFFNPGAERMLGYEDGSARGNDAEELYAPGAYQRIHGPLEAKLAEAEKAGRAELGPLDSALLHSDGSIRSVKISYRMLADRRFQPAEIYTIGIFRDRTDSARREAQHRRLLEMLRSMGIAYFRAGLDGRPHETSAAEADILGYSEATLLETNRSQLFEHSQDRATLLRSAHKAAAGELVPVRQPLRRKDGTRVSTEGYMRTVHETLEHGRATVEGLYRDVTRRLEIQGFIDAPKDRAVSDDVLFEKLKEHDQRQHDYLSGLGHQLLTPLGSLVGNLDDLHSGLLRDTVEIDDSLKWIIGQAKQCMRMVRNLSYMDKILRHETFAMSKVSMAKICIETKIDFQHLLDEKHLRLNIDDRSLDTHLTVRGHTDLIRQIVVNLVDNAIKYSRQRSTITIHGVAVPRGRMLEISNEGLPIPAALRTRVFERGFRTVRARSWVPHGTGLGLWLAGLILEAHGASITCDKVKERGRPRTRFRVFFPHPEPHRGRRPR